MHALASQGRLKDISRDVAHEYQRTSCSLALSELSVAGSVAGVDDRKLSNAVDSYVDYVAFRRPTADGSSWMKDRHPAETSTTSAVLPPASLHRLEQLENELASLNHARRRLVADDDVGAGSSSSRYGALADFDQVDVKQSVDHDRRDHAVAGGGGEWNVSSWLSSSHGDVAALQRRQMCGGSVFTASTAVITSCVQSSPLTSWRHRDLADEVSSLARLANSQHNGSMTDNGGASPARWCGRPVISTRTWTDNSDAENRHTEGPSSAFPRTPAKRELPSPPPDPAAECPSTSINLTNRLESNYTLSTYWTCLLTFCSELH